MRLSPVGKKGTLFLFISSSSQIKQGTVLILLSQMQRKNLLQPKTYKTYKSEDVSSKQNRKLRPKNEGVT